MGNPISVSLGILLVLSLLSWGEISALPANSASADLAGNTPLLISVAKGGAPANGISYSPTISSDGRYTAFVSQASNLVDGDTNNSADVFLYDRTSGDTRRVSVSSSGEQAAGWSYQPAISGDGRYIAFTSRSANLAAPGSLPQQANIYVYDRLKKETRQVSIAPGGKPANGWSEWPAISADGRFIAFTSLANNLVPGDDNSVADIFLYNLLSSQAVRVSQPSSSNGGKWSIHPALSADGRYIAYAAIETTQLGENVNIYLYDRLTGLTQCLTCSAGGFTGQAARDEPVISADGSLVVFAGWLTDSLPRQDPRAALFLFNRITSRFTPVPGSQAAQPNDIQYALSSDGSSLLFSTPANSNNDLQIYKIETQKTAFLQPNVQADPTASPERQLALSAAGDSLAFAASPATTARINSQTGIFLSQLSQAPAPAFSASGWVSNGLGQPLVGVVLRDDYNHQAITGPDGSFQLDGLKAHRYTLAPTKKGYKFTPQSIQVVFTQSAGSAYGLAFVATPEEILDEARKDIGMPYALTRGCSSPFKECGGPFHGFFSGDCTDLVLDAYREGADFNLQFAIDRDFYLHPDHYYRWRNARSSQDMWRYFVYSGQMLSPDQPYLPGDIVFFDWEGDGVSDHVSIVSDVNSKGRPRKMIDATGVIFDNPGGLAAELDWRIYHDNHVQGHARWSGASLGASTRTLADASLLLIALDSPTAQIRLLDAQGRAVSKTDEQIPGSVYRDTGNGALISLDVTNISPDWYFIELTSPISSAYQLGIQTVQRGDLTASLSAIRESSARDVQLIPLQLQKNDGKLTVSAPTLNSTLTPDSAAGSLP
jgi:Tol biopolymer transport system component